MQVFSDVALAKICKKHRIPVPGRGFWQKKATGKQIHQPPLPAVNNPVLNQIHVYKKPENAMDNQETKAQLALHEQVEEVQDNRIVVASVLCDPHPLVEATKATLSKSKPGENGIFKRTARRCLDVNVTEGTLDRSMLIMDALIKALEARDRGFLSHHPE